MNQPLKMLGLEPGATAKDHLSVGRGQVRISKSLSLGMGIPARSPGCRDFNPSVEDIIQELSGRKTFGRTAPTTPFEF